MVPASVSCKNEDKHKAMQQHSTDCFFHFSKTVKERASLLPCTLLSSSKQKLIPTVKSVINYWDRYKTRYMVSQLKFHLQTCPLPNNNSPLRYDEWALFDLSLELSLICKPTRCITEVSYLFTVKQKNNLHCKPAWVVRMQSVAHVTAECVPAVSVMYGDKVWQPAL